MGLAGSAVVGSVTGLAANKLYEQLIESDKQHADFSKRMMQLLQIIANVDPATWIDLSAGRAESSAHRMVTTHFIASGFTADETVELQIGGRGRFDFVWPGGLVNLEFPGLLLDRGIQCKVTSNGAIVAGSFAYLFGRIKLLEPEPGS